MKSSLSNMKVLATICARGGSKGVPGKNLRLIAGLPLIAHTIRYAKAQTCLTDIVVSTDSREIADAARKEGVEVPFMRPAEMADDRAAKMPVIRHAAEQMESLKGYRYDIVVDLDVTCPMRKSGDLEGALALMQEKKANAVLSATPSSKNPYFNIAEQDAEGWAHLCKKAEGPFFSRQTAPATYDLNGSIFAFRRDALEKATTAMMEKTVVWVMDEAARDIDREIDFKVAEHYLKNQPSLEMA